MCKRCSIRHPPAILCCALLAGAVLLPLVLCAQEKADSGTAATRPARSGAGLRGDEFEGLVDQSDVPVVEPEIKTKPDDKSTLWELDGTMVVDRRGTVERDPQSGWSLLTFLKDPDLPPAKPRWLLPGELLEAIEPIVDKTPNQVFRITGETTVFQNQLYLLLRKVTIETPQASAAATKAEPREPAKPAAAGATTGPAKAGRPSADDILQELLKDRPGTPVVPDGMRFLEKPGSAKAATRPAAEPTPGPEADKDKPATRPATGPAAPKPQDPKRLGSDEILKGLLEDRPGEPVIVPSVSQRPTDVAPSVAPQTTGEVLPPAHGRLVTDCVVRILPTGLGIWHEVHFEADNTLMEPPMRLLPCHLLARAMRLADEGRNKLRISGEVTRYKGQQYLLLRKVLRVRDLGKF